MLARLFLIAIALLAIPVVPALAVPFSGLSVNGAQIFGFDSATPGIITSTLTLTQPVTSIAMLPATGELYGVANQNGTVFSPLNIYTINTVTGAETLLAVTSVPVNGSVDGISFDPVTDQLRIIVRPSSGGNPLRRTSLQTRYRAPR